MLISGQTWKSLAAVGIAGHHLAREREALRRTSMDPHSSRPKPQALEPNGEAGSEAPPAAAAAAGS